MSKQKLPNGVDVIVRLHDPSRFTEMDRAVFSIFNQVFRPVNVVIVAQRFTALEIDEIAHKLSIYQKDDAFNISITNVVNPSSGDIRSKLLNVGISQCKYRFMAILDADDYVYENSYQRLVSELLKSKSHAAFGNIKVKHVSLINDWVYNLFEEPNKYNGSSASDLVYDNFCPIHSFLLDRSAFDASDLQFNESLSRLEDYEFLLRIATKYKLHFIERSFFVGVYNWHIDGKNSILTMNDDKDIKIKKIIEWSAGSNRIWRQKISIRASD